MTFSPTRSGSTTASSSERLAERGFDVSPASHSNYLSTIPSLISFLNHRHLADVPEVAAQVGHPDGGLGPAAHRAIEVAAVLDEARAAGYETVALAGGFEDTEVRSADRFLDGSQLNDFELTVLRPTMLAPTAIALDSDAFSGSQRARIEWMFARSRGWRPRRGRGPNSSSPTSPRRIDPGSSTATVARLPPPTSRRGTSGRTSFEARPPTSGRGSAARSGSPARVPCVRSTRCSRGATRSSGRR
jgi:hypothetical protein